MSRRNAGATDAVVDAPSPARRTMPHGPQHAQALRSHHVRRSVALAATAVVAFVGAGAATAAYTLSGNIESTNVDDALAHVERPTPPPADPNAGTPLNIVLLGIDSRDGDNINFASAENTAGARSDTTMVMHISADRDRVELISIPRDSTVSMPGCPLKDDKMSSPMSSTKFNSAFAVGYDYGGSVTAGATCTLTTIESLTDVRMDGFITIDFAGFQRMVDALGGVDICIPEAIDAPDAGLLKLDAGEQHLDGTQALQFARARKGKGLGDGSDLGRIGRQ
ncbi:MAG: LCP family protein, partial [Cellulomonadaceae bacterium]|nr:LCP family protein [Cellulomonadaceae bacterium]